MGFASCYAADSQIKPYEYTRYACTITSKAALSIYMYVFQFYTYIYIYICIYQIILSDTDLKLRNCSSYSRQNYSVYCGLVHKEINLVVDRLTDRQISSIASFSSVFLLYRCCIALLLNRYIVFNDSSIKERKKQIKKERIHIHCILIVLLPRK